MGGHSLERHSLGGHSLGEHSLGGQCFGTFFTRGQSEWILSILVLDSKLFFEKWEATINHLFEADKIPALMLSVISLKEDKMLINLSGHSA